jgi:hypothetical protein
VSRVVTIALAAALLVVAAAGAVYLAHHHASERRVGGPLDCDDCGRTAMGIEVRVGQPASFGLLALQNSGVRSAILEAVRLLDVDPGLEVIDMLVDQSPDGLEVLRGSSTYTYDGNWKVQAENGADGYHVTATHWNYAATTSRRRKRVPRRRDRRRDPDVAAIGERSYRRMRVAMSGGQPRSMRSTA